MPVQLDRYDNSRFTRGRSLQTEALWSIVDALFVRSRLPGSAHRRWLLRLFGARVGKSVVIKPGARVKFPWRLAMGSNTWIGEDVWIDNLEHVEIGANCCVSQGAYLCTGSHDVTLPTFDLIAKPIVIRDGAWIAARAIVGPGVIVGEGAVLALGSVAMSNLDPWRIYAGVPAKMSRERRLIDPDEDEIKAQGPVGVG
jgi:putative colanic acid biosynthesis acetyltransferase WcaF